jgi:hypothetical protein
MSGHPESEDLAVTPEPPYVAVILTRMLGCSEGYAEVAEKMEQLVAAKVNEGRGKRAAELATFPYALVRGLTASALIMLKW